MRERECVCVCVCVCVIVEIVCVVERVRDRECVSVCVSFFQTYLFDVNSVFMCVCLFIMKKERERLHRRCLSVFVLCGRKRKSSMYLNFTQLSSLCLHYDRGRERAKET